MGEVKQNMAAQLMAETTEQCWKRDTVLVVFIGGDPDGIFKALSHNYYGPERARHLDLRRLVSTFMVSFDGQDA